ncbi:hypothetical protein P3T76_010435 [Phytophthora citrophthora]|uniref:Uncharacterized protein n=1 Tax=Phytophthora citrophthora TaxID=4793 RepID=A0AAD9GCB0_9STRA|nr:hypothetical protein P3T76_010424 [Phytophthora citrophthora]KAK1935740.1 hypothetical protein P3T76_010435 [Phytophthora citrophthora]
MGHCHQQLQILTLLKHQLVQYSDILTPKELDVVSEIFDWVTRRGNVVVARLPHWFAASELEWFRATTVQVGQEACERQATLWVKLHHPNQLTHLPL